jgi:hypothetical protein
MRFMPVASRPWFLDWLAAKAVLLAGVAIAVLAHSPIATAYDDEIAFPLIASTGASAKLSPQQASRLDFAGLEAQPTETRHSTSQFESDPIENAVLFINGDLVAPPLVVTAEADRVLVNSVELTIDEQLRQTLNESGYFESGADPADFEGSANGPGIDRQRSRNRRRVFSEDLPPEADKLSRKANAAGKPGRGAPKARGMSTVRTARAVASWLDTGRSVTVAFTGQRPITLTMTDGGLELLTALQTGGKDRNALDTVLKRLSSDGDAEAYLAWISSFQSTPAFHDLVVANTEFITRATENNVRQTAAVDRLRTMSYPMSILGLLLSVFAFGHVVSNKPPTRFAPVTDELSPEIRLMVNRCLLLVVALSLLDLIWTILASQANQMTELNPLGREFIQNAALLGAFKFVMTGVGVGLLFALKQHRIAQTAAWWACMILTLLTMRWLTFNSMFA